MLVFFVISNVGFYAFSGYFTDQNAIDFALRVATYLPGYLAQAFLYSGAGLALAHALIRGGHTQAVA